MAPEPQGRALAELQRVTDAALAHLTLDDLLAELLERIAEILHTDTAAILLLDGDLLPPARRRASRRRSSRASAIPVGTGFAGRIAAERRPIVIPDVDHADVLNPILREKGIRSLLGVPLLVEDRVARRAARRHADPARLQRADLELLQFAADRAALRDRPRRALRAASATRARRPSAPRRRAARVQRVTDAALAYLSVEDLLSRAADPHRARSCHADTAAILMLDDDGRAAARARRQGHRGGGRAGRPDPASARASPAASRPSAGRSSIPDVDHADVVNPILREKGIRSLLGVPLLVEGRVLGVLHVGTLTPRDFTDDDATCCSSRPTAPRWRSTTRSSYEQRRVAEALQRSLLPEALPDGARARARRALPAGGAGDEPRRRLVRRLPARRRHDRVAVGDVVGRGLAGGRADGAAAHRAARVRLRRPSAGATSSTA